MIAGTNDTRYAFVNGIVRSREAQLLGRAHFDRLISADIDSFGPLLADSDYRGSTDFLGTLETVAAGERVFFNEHCYDAEVRRMLDWPEQIHNIKVRLKNGNDAITYPVATGEAETWPEAVAAIAAYEHDHDPFLLSAALDRITADRVGSLSGISPFFTNYYQRFFDLENIRSFFRARFFEEPVRIFSLTFLGGGTMPVDRFLTSLTAANDAVPKAFAMTPYHTIIESGWRYLEHEGSFLRLERMCEEARLQAARSARFLTFGVEPLFGYFQFKTAEIRKLRQVYLGKRNGISDALIKESIADVW